MTDCSVSLKRCATLRAHKMPNVMPVAARLLSRSIEKSFLTVRPSPYARPRSGTSLRREPGEKSPKGTHFSRASNRANLRAPCRGVRRFATSGLFLRSLRRNTVPHAPGPVGRSVRSRTGARQSRRPPRKPGAAFSCRNIPEPSAKNSPDYFPPLTQRTENAFCCGKFIFALGLATAVVAKPRKDPFSPLASSPVQ